MTTSESAVTKGGLSGWSTRSSVLVLTLIMVVVPTGLAFHGALHSHEIDDFGDCSLCILGSLFFAEIPSVRDADLSRDISALPGDDPALPLRDEFSCVNVRGPPASSV